MSDNMYGAELLPDGAVRFRLWAPAVQQVRIEIAGEPDLLLMESRGAGWHEFTSRRARCGSLYCFVLPGGMKVPDPASRFQPRGVHGQSEVVDPARWRSGDRQWCGRPWEEAVVYELHIGAFTPEGTFRAAIDRLDHLAAVGVTAIEIMPVSAFAGARNWGYDGVLPFAPDSSYGRPEDLRALVEAAHARGLMVLLDVVYNHFGPEGNYLSVYAPPFFSEKHKTPWGPAINFDGQGSGNVRKFFVENALHWVNCFHLDGLRLDAVHAIIDDSPKHILREVAEHVRSAAGNRYVHLVLENGENEAHWLARDAKLYTAQWNDDLHHVLHTAITQESKGYYGEYLGDSAKLGRAVAEGFAFQGQTMTYRNKERGEPSAQLPPAAFVAFLQNHDQIGNRAFGDRLTASVSAPLLRAAGAVYLLLPQIPMLFMGEEWGARQPFPFFCDFGPDLAEAVRNGRREEFARFPEFQDREQRDRIPDPQSEQTFASAKLQWAEIADAPHREWLQWYGRVLATRRESILPLLNSIRNGGVFEVIGKGAIVARWEAGPFGELVLAANLSGESAIGFPDVASKVIWREGAEGGQPGTLRPWTVVWSIEPPREERS